jgi:hypothetical protein
MYMRLSFHLRRFLIFSRAIKPSSFKHRNGADIIGNNKIAFMFDGDFDQFFLASGFLLCFKSFYFC